MKKIIYLLIIVLTQAGCKSSLINYALEKNGIYDDKIVPKSISAHNKQIVFLPLQHVGRKEYYDDVKHNIDSLKKEGYMFFYEKVKNDTQDSLELYKFRKIIHFGVPKEGYLDLLESLSKTKIKFKYPLVNQPSNYDFGLTDENSSNVDMSIREIISNVEKDKTINLEDCDFLNRYTETYKCTNRLLTQEEWNKYLLDDRNVYLVQEIKKSNHSKIAIIYGKAHLPGVESELLK